MTQSTRPQQRLPCLVCAIALGALAAGAVAQSATGKEKQPKWKLDPYSKNEPAALKKAGYVSYGPFPFGNLGTRAITTDDVEKTLPYIQIRWIETAHFRLGIELPAWSVPEDPVSKAKLRGELTRLAEKLPGINPKTRTLDPWLRTHLFAQRVEDVYAEFCHISGVKDADFPPEADKVVIRPGAVYMGQGPYLGMKDKFMVLLLEKEASFSTYMQTYLGRDSKFGQRWHCKDAGCLLYTIAADCDEGRHKDDTALHCNVAFNISQNLLDGFRYYSYDLPVWMREGISHWFERRVDPHWNSFDQTEGSPAEMKKAWRWEPQVRAMLTTTGKFAPFSEAYTWRDFGNITFNDHMAIWSRFDFLMSLGPAKWKTFLFEVKGRVTKDWLPDQSDLVGASRDALQKAYGFSVLEFDEKWAEWVKANYAAQ